MLYDEILTLWQGSQYYQSLILDLWNNNNERHSNVDLSTFKGLILSNMLIGVFFFFLNWTWVSKDSSPSFNKDGPSVMDRRWPRPLATPRPLPQQRLRSPAERSGPRTHRDGSSLTSENLLDRSLYDLDLLLLCPFAFLDLRRQWREKIPGKVTSGSPSALPHPLTETLSTQAAEGTFTLHIIYVYSIFILSLLSFICIELLLLTD